MRGCQPLPVQCISQDLHGKILVIIFRIQILWLLNTENIGNFVTPNVSIAKPMLLQILF